MNLASLFVDVGYRDGTVGVGIDKTRGQLVSLSAIMTRVNSVGTSMWSVIGGGVAAVTAGVALHSLFENTMEAEKGQRALKSALMATGQEVDRNFEVMKDFADQIKDTYNVDDDLVIASESLATNLGVQAGEMKSVITAAVGLSNVMGTDLKSATESVVKATQGGFREFERLFPQMKAMTSETEKLAFIQKISAQGLVAQKDSVNTLGGSIESLKLATSDLGKAFGESFGPSLTVVLKKASDGVKSLGQTFLELQYLYEKIKDDSPNNTRLAEINKQLNKLTGDTGDATAATDLHTKAQQQLNEAYKNGKMSLTDYWFALGEGSRKAAAATGNGGLGITKVDGFNEKERRDQLKGRTPAYVDAAIAAQKSQYEKQTKAREKAVDDAKKKAESAKPPSKLGSTVARLSRLMASADPGKDLDNALDSLFITNRAKNLPLADEEERQSRDKRASKTGSYQPQPEDSIADPYDRATATAQREIEEEGQRRVAKEKLDAARKALSPGGPPLWMQKPFLQDLDKAKDRQVMIDKNQHPERTKEQQTLSEIRDYLKRISEKSVYATAS